MVWLGCTWFQIPRDSDCKPVTDIINEKCDVTRPSDPKEKVKVTVTGVGSNFFRVELEAELNIEYVDYKIGRTNGERETPIYFCLNGFSGGYSRSL